MEAEPPRWWLSEAEEVVSSAKTGNKNEQPAGAAAQVGSRVRIEPMDCPVRVALAVRHPRSRYGLRALLGTLDGVEVVWEAATGCETLGCVQDHRPDVVVVDLQMPGADGLETAWQIKKRWPDVRVVALALYDGDRAQATAAGADGFVVKGCPSQDLLAAIHPGPRLASHPAVPSNPAVLAPAMGG
jgi:CheY-like chemotaxis protein